MSIQSKTKTIAKSDTRRGPRARRGISGGDHYLDGGGGGAAQMHNSSYSLLSSLPSSLLPASTRGAGKETCMRADKHLHSAGRRRRKRFDRRRRQCWSRTDLPPPPPSFPITLRPEQRSYYSCLSLAPLSLAAIPAPQFGPICIWRPSAVVIVNNHTWGKIFAFCSLLAFSRRGLKQAGIELFLCNPGV